MDNPSPGNILSDEIGRLIPPTAATAQRQTAAFTPAPQDPPLREASAAQLRAGFVANLHALFRAMAGLPGATLHESEQIAYHHALPGSPMFKGIWRANLPQAEADAHIEQAIDWFRAREAPFAFWWCEESSRPPDLPVRLQPHGFVPWEENAPGMAAELAVLDFALIERTPQGFSMERVRDEAGLHDFCTAFVAGMQIPRWAGEAWVDATLAAGIEQSPWHCYVGRLHGEPVASNILFCGAGVASVFGVATAPAARRQGIGAAITLLPYQDALAAGYQYGVLFATELGAPVYRRMGFRDEGSSISRYLWRA